MTVSSQDLNAPYDKPKQASHYKCVLHHDMTCQVGKTQAEVCAVWRNEKVCVGSWMAGDKTNIHDEWAQ